MPDNSFIETINHLFGGAITTLELKQPQQGAGTDARIESTSPAVPSANVPPIIDPDATGPF